MCNFIWIFSFLQKHKRLIAEVFLETFIINLIMSNEIDNITIIKSIICSIISFLTKMRKD